MNKYKLKVIMEKLKDHKNISNSEQDAIYEGMKHFFVDRFANVTVFYEYPVNLLDDLMGQHCVFTNKPGEILSRDEACTNLDEALKTLPDKNESIMRLFYQFYNNVDNIAVNYDI